MVPENFTGLAELVSPAVVNIRTVKTIKGGGRVFRHFRGPFDKDDPMREFFEKDLVSAINEVHKAMKYEKYGLPNWRTELLRRQMGVEEAETNLNTINRAILEYVKST